MGDILEAKYVGIGVRRFKWDKTLDVFYPVVYSDPSPDLLDRLKKTLLTKEENYGILDVSAWDQVPLLQSLKKDCHRYYQQEVVCAWISDDKASVANAVDGYFRLHLLSKKFVKPHDISLDGLFGSLSNCAWTSEGPVFPEDVDFLRLELLNEGKELTVTHIDKFPYMVNYVIPEGVRIASGSQVRLGAYLGDGTTVMPSGFVNFNAGTEGPAMVEGRVSAGVFVGKNSDLGGGASVMGTLSGGNHYVISIGENCLIGANAGTGISLGNGCTIAAGLYVYAGKKVSLYDAFNKPIDIEGKSVAEGQNVVKAMSLSGRDNMLFIEDSQTGRLICRPNLSQIELNQELHKNI